jgi:hypothetical protein
MKRNASPASTVPGKHSVGDWLQCPWLSACEEEGLTFTRGRPDCKNDQCFIEQKNGAVVRQVVEHARFEGRGVCTQLGELYQALRLYVNCFQPSMKLLAKQSDGQTVRQIYDPAKKPLQRLLRSKVLSTAQEREVTRMAALLSPLRLFAHVQERQQALFAAVMATLSPEPEEAEDQQALHPLPKQPLAPCRELRVGVSRFSTSPACKATRIRCPHGSLAAMCSCAFVRSTWKCLWAANRC